MRRGIVEGERVFNQDTACLLMGQSTGGRAICSGFTNITSVVCHKSNIPLETLHSGPFQMGQGAPWASANSCTKITSSQNILCKTYVFQHLNDFQPEHLVPSTYMCSSTNMTFSQKIFKFWSFFGVRVALGQTRLAHMQEPLTRIPNLILTQKWRSAPMLKFPEHGRAAPPTGNFFSCSTFIDLRKLCITFVSPYMIESNCSDSLIKERCPLARYDLLPYSFL